MESSSFVTPIGHRSPLPFRRVSGRKRSLFYTQFARMLDAGLAPVRCLETLGGQRMSWRLSRAALDMSAHIQGGGSLASALARHPTIFPPNEIRMIEAAERTGGVAETMLRLSDSLDAMTRFWRKLVTGFIYPAILLLGAYVLVPLVLAILFDLFGGPWALLWTKAQELAVLFGIYLAALTAWRSLMLIGPFRLTVHRLLLLLPVFGKLARRLATARFADTLECMYAAGVPTPEAMARSAVACGNAVVGRSILRAVPSVEAGGSLTQALRTSRAIPPLLLNMVAVGEEAGKLEESLHKVAEYERDDAEATIERLAKIIPHILALLVILWLATLVFQAWSEMIDAYHRQLR
jgi:type IV pilus assembly protein PilC